MPDNGMLPFICKLDKKEDVHDPQNWQMANPSLPYRPELMAEIEKEYRDWLKSPNQFTAFMTKRMNIPDGNPEVEVASWENIIATNKPMIDLKGQSAVVGIDYSKLQDMAAVNIHFKIGDQRYDINHAWLCLKSPDLPRIKAPWQQWADEGYLTLVKGVEIHPDLITDYIEQQMHKYNIIKLALDNFRFALLAKSLERIGFDATIQKNIKLVRPSDIMKVAPVIDSVFVNQQFTWGEQPVLRWATNNTKQVKVGKTQGQDIGNYIYAKIEGRSRKTDPFMALAHAMTIEQDMPEVQTTLLDLDVRTY
jgi:phage terminase large subunit-like protein